MSTQGPHATSAAASRFPEALKLRVPRGMGAALATVARRRHQTASDYLRQLVLDRLEAEGVRLDADGAIETRRP